MKTKIKTKKFMAIFLSLTTMFLTFLYPIPNAVHAESAPVLYGNSVYRDTATTAKVTFLPSKAGKVYYAVTDSETAPTITPDGTGEEVVAGISKTLNLTSDDGLTSGAKYVHIIVEDGGSTSNTLTVAMPYDTYYFNDFESYNVGTHPTDAGWTEVYGQIAKVVMSGENKYMSILGTNSSHGQFAQILPGSLDNIIILEADMRPISSVSTDTGSLNLTDNSQYRWGAYIARVEFKNGKIITYTQTNSTGTVYELGDFTPNTWYHVKMVCDIDEKTYQVYVDDVLMTSTVEEAEISEFPMLPDSPKEVQIISGSSIDFDNIKFYMTDTMPAKYAVTYDLNSGGGTAPTETNKAAGATFSAAATTEITPPTGTVFKEWNTSADGKGTGYDPGDTVTMPESALTLYAIWKYEAPAAAPTLNTKTYNSITLNATSGYEYSRDGGDNWQSNNLFEGLNASTIYTFVQRKAASGNIHASDKSAGLNATTDAAPTYEITMQNDGNGIASASPTSAAAGTEVTLSAQPSSGYKFKEWQVVSGGITITANKFTMPANAVTIKAIFEPLPLTAYTITMQNDGNGTGVANKTSETAGEVITLTSYPNTGYKFKEWQVVNGGITITENEFTMPANSVTVKAVFEASTYNIIKGMDETREKDSTDGLTIISNGDFEKFLGIKINGNTLSDSNYNAVSGSTVVTLKPVYLNGLAEGKYDVEFLYTDGSAYTTFTIGKPEPEEVPDAEASNTGDQTIWTVIGLSAILIISAGILIFINRKKFKKG